jgi:uracil-DNA glycosylase
MSWKEILAPVLQTPKMQEVKKHLQEERKTKAIYPAGKDVFRAFDLCPYNNTKVVILGQDPYHTKDTADGLAFSTKQSKRPPSLEVIFKEIYKDLNIQYYHNETFEEYFPTNNLEKWAYRGFLLLNTVLTVEEGKAGSHKDLGWDAITRKVFEALNKMDRQVIFLLWGKEAQKYKELIDPSTKHVAFTAGHPATELYNDGKGSFYGSRHFSIVRDILPEIECKDIMPAAGLDSCFDKEKAKEIVREAFPLEAEQMCNYIDRELIINVPVNRETYWKEIRKFEDDLSTKY